jgi:hypothetical protein
MAHMSDRLCRNDTVVEHQNGDLTVPVRAETDDVIGDGYLRLSKGSSEWEQWAAWLRRIGDPPQFS